MPGLKKSDVGVVFTKPGSEDSNGDVACGLAAEDVGSS